MDHLVLLLCAIYTSKLKSFRLGEKQFVCLFISFIIYLFFGRNISPVSQRLLQRNGVIPEATDVSLWISDHQLI